MKRWSASKVFTKSIIPGLDLIQVYCDILNRLRIERLLIYSNFNHFNDNEYNLKAYNRVKETVLKEMEGKGD